MGASTAGQPATPAASPKRRGLCGSGFAASAVARRAATGVQPRAASEFRSYTFDRELASNDERSPKPPRRVVRLGAVVIDEHLAVAAIAEQGAAECADVG